MKYKLISAALLSVTFAFSAATVHAEAPNLHKSLWLDSSRDTSETPSQRELIIGTDGSSLFYDNEHWGVRLKIPSNWTVDRHEPSAYLRFFGDDFRVDVTYDNLQPIKETPETFITNTLNGISNVQKLESYKTTSGLVVDSYAYQRSRISVIADLNVYTYYFVHNGNSIFTFQLKTDTVNQSNLRIKIKEMIESMEVGQPAVEDLNAEVNPVVPQNPISIPAENKTLQLEPGKTIFGIFEPFSTGPAAVRETELDTHLGSQMVYKAIDNPVDTNLLNNLVRDGKVPVLTFQMRSLIVNPDETDTLQKIINGDYDSHIKSWALAVKSTKSPFFIRLGNEMNADWVNWGHKYNYNDPDIYKLAYRHIVDIYRNNGVTNAKFVWNPNVKSSPLYSWNADDMYYPGDDYVDWLGLTSYNFAKNEWHGFQYFDELYEDVYKRYLRTHPGKPMLIGEFGSVEENGNKAHFFRDMLHQLKTKYTNIRLVIWFNATDAEFDFRYNTTPSSTYAFRDILKDDSVSQYPLVDSIPGIRIATQPNETTNQSRWTLTGVALSSEVTNVFVNGKPVTFLRPDWRQFDVPMILENGPNVVPIRVQYSNGDDLNFTYVVNKASSFRFASPIGQTPLQAAKANIGSVVKTGVVLDSSIATMKINGQETPIKWGWRQFDIPLQVGPGMNRYVVTGHASNGAELVREYVYLFEDGDIKVTSLPTEVSNFYDGLKRTITGMAPSSKISKVKVDGKEQELKFSWRQFDQDIQLVNGENHVIVDAIYSDSLDGEAISYPVYRKYTVHTPFIRMSTSGGFTPQKAALIPTPNTVMTGLVVDPRVKAITINGQPFELKHAWKQFDYSYAMKTGMNRVVFRGYSDAERQNQISENVVYLFNDSDLRIVTPASTDSFTEAAQITFTGIAGTPIQEVRVNGIVQTLKFAWRQFDQTVSLPKSGNNIVKVEATYVGIDNGQPYTYLIQKQYVLHRPSFTYTTPVSHSLTSAIQTSASTETIKGIVSDVDVKSISINNNPVSLGSNREFSYTVNLNPNMNGIKVIGYADANRNTKLFEETLYFFNDSGFRVTKPETLNYTSTTKDVLFSGYLAYDQYKRVRINGVNQTLKESWKQFDYNMNFKHGTYNVILEADFEDNYFGIPYKYIVKKNYKIVVPTTVYSFEFWKPIGKTAAEATETVNATEWLGITLKDSSVNSVTVNGIKTTLNQWRQISVGVPLVKGLNKITVIGYADTNFGNKVVEEVFYVYRK